jgi:hypothetical protein
MTGRVGAQILVAPTSYSASSELNNTTYAVGNLFDGTISSLVVGQSTGEGEQYAASGLNADNDFSPIVEMAFASTLTFSGVGYAQRNTSTVSDQVSQINLYFMTQPQYNNYTLAINTPPTNTQYTTEETVTPTVVTNGSAPWEEYSFGGTVTAQYVVAQFIHDAPLGQNSGDADNPGGSEFLMEEAAVPEPSTWALVLVGIAGLGLRRRFRALV